MTDGAAGRVGSLPQEWREDAKREHERGNGLDNARDSQSYAYGCEHTYDRCADALASRLGQAQDRLTALELNIESMSKFTDELKEQLGQAQARIAALEQELHLWRSWAQFVFHDGGPISGTDDELRKGVCERYDREMKHVESEADRAIDQVNAIRNAEIQMLSTAKEAAEARLHAIRQPLESLNADMRDLVQCADGNISKQTVTRWADQVVAIQQQVREGKPLEPCHCTRTEQDLCRLGAGEYCRANHAL